MTTLDPLLVETLLNMAESNTLDFKQAQYPFAGESDEAKSELVKDILAFANAWKTSDAHIVIGAKDGAGKRATVQGVANQLDDADVQQLVNGKTNVPVVFAYIPASVDGLPIAVIRVAQAQQRPIFLRKRLGPLREGEVFVRRGSSTDTATPDEVARMGEARATSARVPELTLALGNPSTHELFSAPVTVRSRILVDRPPDRTFEGLASIGALKAAVMVRDFNKPSPEKLAAYRRECALLTRLAFAVKNTGQVLLEDVRIRIEVPKSRGFVLLDAKPPKPQGMMDLPLSRFSVRGVLPCTDVVDRGKLLELEARLGKVQTHATAWSAPFWIGSSVAKKHLVLAARVFADNLPKPIDVDLVLAVKVVKVPDDAPHSEDEDDNDE